MAIIGKTKELKIFNFLNKEYHINEKINSLKREKNKRILVKGNTIAKMLFIASFTRERSFNQLLEKIHIRKKYKNMFGKKEHIPKAHVFRDGVKELKQENLKQINKSIIMKAIKVILQMMIVSYNLWELYLYGHLHDFEKSKITKLGYIEMITEVMSMAKVEELRFSSA